MKILHFPLVKVFFCFIIGLFMAYKDVLSLTNSQLFLAGCMVLLTGFFVIKRFQRIQTTILDGSILITAVALGASVFTLHTESYHKNHYTQFKLVDQQPVRIQAIIREKLKKTGTNERYIAQVIQVNQQKADGKIVLNLANHSLTELAVGTIIQTKSRVLSLPSPKNPYQFDYATYLKNKQVYAQVFVPSETIQIRKTPQKDLWFYTSKIRATIATHLKESGLDPSTLAITMALLLGQQQEIDSSLIKDYQFAGAVHILSVSGLHIGCLVLFLNFVLQPISNSKKGRTLKLIISILSLALFGVLAGLAPSVLRSITMFSFVAIGNYWNKNTNIYHTLIVSALLILLFQPFLIVDVGFQLSYAALFFIVWLQPIFTNLWKVQNKILLFFWNIITVSFAAQLGTLPISLYYFHQFPSLFFVTNLAVLPLVSIIMILGVVVMMVALFSKVPFILAIPLSLGIQIMNSIIHWVASVESFVFQNISFSFGLLLASYTLLIAFFIWFQHKNNHALLLFLVSIIGIQLVFLSKKIEQSNENEWLILHTPKATTLCERNGQLITVFTHKTNHLLSEPHRAVQDYATGIFGKIKEIIPLKNTYCFKGNKILVVDSTGIVPANIKCDVLLLTKNPKVNLERVLTQHHPKIVVADGSNYKSWIQRWKNSCIQQKIPFHATAEKGYYTLRE